MNKQARELGRDRKFSIRKIDTWWWWSICRAC